MRVLGAGFGLILIALGAWLLYWGPMAPQSGDLSGFGHKNRDLSLHWRPLRSENADTVSLKKLLESDTWAPFVGHTADLPELDAAAVQSISALLLGLPSLVAADHKDLLIDELFIQSNHTPHDAPPLPQSLGGIHEQRFQFPYPDLFVAIRPRSSRWLIALKAAQKPWLFDSFVAEKAPKDIGLRLDAGILIIDEPEALLRELGQDRPSQYLAPEVLAIVAQDDLILISTNPEELREATAQIERLKDPQDSDSTAELFALRLAGGMVDRTQQILADALGAETYRQLAWSMAMERPQVLEVRGRLTAASVELQIGGLNNNFGLAPKRSTTVKLAGESLAAIELPVAAGTLLSRGLKVEQKSPVSPLKAWLDESSPLWETGLSGQVLPAIDAGQIGFCFAFDLPEPATSWTQLELILRANGEEFQTLESAQEWQLWLSSRTQNAQVRGLFKVRDEGILWANSAAAAGFVNREDSAGKRNDLKPNQLRVRCSEGQIAAFFAALSRAQKARLIAPSPKLVAAQEAKFQALINASQRGQFTESSQEIREQALDDMMHYWRTERGRQSLKKSSLQHFGELLMEHMKAASFSMSEKEAAIILTWH